MKFKKRGGVVGELISGTGGLIILTVLVLVVVSTLLGAGIIDDVTSTKTITGESGAWLNSTTYTVAQSGADNFNTLTLTGANNYTGATPTSVALTNFTVSGAGFTNATAQTYSNLTINYTFVSTDLNYSQSADLMGSNYTSGIDNVSGKIPTILLIAAVVILFTVIVLLVRQTGSMGMGSGGSSL